MNTNAVVKSPMSDTLISKYFNGRPNIVQMAEVSQMTTINQIFKGYDHAVIFVAVNSPTDGHWQFIYKNGHELNFFDSYGMGPTDLVKKVKGFGQNTNLETLIQNSQFRNNAYKNNVKYQNDGEPATCGRYVSLCFILKYIYNKRGLGFDGSIYYKIMTHLKKMFKGESYDKIVSVLIDQVDLNTI